MGAPVKNCLTEPPLHTLRLCPGAPCSHQRTWAENVVFSIAFTCPQTSDACLTRSSRQTSEHSGEGKAARLNPAANERNRTIQRRPGTEYLGHPQRLQSRN